MALTRLGKEYDNLANVYEAFEVTPYRWVIFQERLDELTDAHTEAIRECIRHLEPLQIYMTRLRSMG